MGLRILHQLHGARCCLSWHMTRIKGIGSFRSRRLDLCSSLCRYKMLVQETWPSYKGIDKDGVGVIISETGYTSDVKYGRTKLFIRTPRTVFELEKLRAEIVPTLVLFLQKVRRNYRSSIDSGTSSANFVSPQNKNSTPSFNNFLKTTSSPSFA